MADDKPAIKVNTDGDAVAIRTVFEDDTPGAVSSWLSVNTRGISTYLTAAQVKDWKAVK